MQVGTYFPEVTRMLLCLDPFASFHTASRASCSSHSVSSWDRLREVRAQGDRWLVRATLAETTDCERFNTWIMCQTHFCVTRIEMQTAIVRWVVNKSNNKYAQSVQGHVPWYAACSVNQPITQPTRTVGEEGDDEEEWLSCFIGVRKVDEDAEEELDKPETTIGTKFSVLQGIRIPLLMRCGFLTINPFIRICVFIAKFRAIIPLAYFRRLLLPRIYIILWHTSLSLHAFALLHWR